MIIQTGNRTDIPAFYADWFANRLREGFVLVRNPFNPVSVTKYRLDPEVVDLIVFCPYFNLIIGYKNPETVAFKRVFGYTHNISPKQFRE